MLTLFFSLLWLACYFAPTFVAYHRRHHQRQAILALNFLLGWTCVGWVAALVWSLTVIEHGRTQAD